MDDNGDQVVGCVAYPHYYTRSPLDQTCEVMPPAVEALVSWAHMLAMPYLTKRSQASMPNACELNLYYTAFDSRIGRHRDNFTSQDLVKYLHNGDPSIVESTTNTQEANTSVLIWTAGNAPMELVLSFPRHASMAGDRATYIVKPEFTVRCSHGTLLIFTPLDDLFFCHEARFPKDVLEDMGAEGYRAAYVIRWLSEERATKVFHANGDRRGKPPYRATSTSPPCCAARRPSSSPTAAGCSRPPPSCAPSCSTACCASARRAARCRWRCR